ncbi:MAG: SIMPL domain-containing protein [Candidatus Pacearchaeota archaeon]|nr:SIMPL domain-containing protein [Candidatus Pacearchaeota archaeon]
MDKSVQITLIIVIAAVVCFIWFFARQVPKNTINVLGQAEIKVFPDIVAIYFAIDTNGSSAKEAKDKNTRIVNSIITELTEKGIEKKHITTESFSVHPEYRWKEGKQELVGYRAIHILKVQLLTNETDRIGNVLDTGVDAGALVNSINFELSLEEQSKYKARALQQATQDAKIKAESIASGLGKKVGKVITINDSSFDYSPWPIYRNEMMVIGAKEAKRALTSIQPGEQTIIARVSAVFEIV